MYRYIAGYSMATKKLLIAFSVEFVKQLDYVAAREHRSRSDLLREAARRYLDEFKRKMATSKDIELVDL